MSSLQKSVLPWLLLFGALPALGQGNSSLKKPGAEQRRKAAPKSTSTVSGRVFAITKGGDLKPARLAAVTLFFESGPGVAAIISAAETTPGLFFLQKYLEALKAKDSTLCLADLAAADKAIAETYDWGGEKNLIKFVRFGDTDEEGYFRIDNVKPGTYELVARGQAGVNDAYWEQEVMVTLEQETTVCAGSA